MHIAHIAVWTRDLIAAAEFWRRYFHAEIGDTYRSARRPGFVSCFVTVPGERASIELMSAPWIADASATEHAGWDHLAISLGSRAAVDEMAARCHADGLLVSAPRTTGDGFYEAVIAAPDGTRIEITA
ncbi:Glyoxalase-like domain protein [Caballeronia hypogeia]|uniref:Glyoxalase-like domain protein n=1 Tax=Caballeronia hypogeia TaxID=1777140 RepID=A0A158AER4_9BURK|nr:VOC family protein [Caballeronia hypogeia]SAK56209.1 Glyoxalase-like domain protein [Caballeronia hypogeia]